MARRAAPEATGDDISRAQSTPRRGLIDPQAPQASEAHDLPRRAAARAAESSFNIAEAPAPRHLQDLTPDNSGLNNAAQQSAEHAAPVAADDAISAQFGSSKSPRRRWLIPVLGLVLALVVAAVIYGLGAPNRQRIKEATQAVQNYFSALSSGDAVAAAELLATNGGDASLLTAEVLAASLQTAPISGIEVGEPTLTSGNSAASVPVKYTLGETQIESNVAVTWDDEQPLIDAAARLELDTISAINPLVNGVSPASANPLVFPGSYQLSLDNPYLEFGSPDLTITDEQSVASVAELKLIATDAGTQMFRNKVTEAIQACLASKALDPGCGAEIPETLSGGETIVADSVGRSLSPEDTAALANIVPETATASPALLTINPSKLGTIILEADVQTAEKKVRAKLDGYGQGFGFTRPSIDVADPGLPVIWD